MKLAMMAYNRVLNTDHEVCNAETLQELITKFEPIKKNTELYFYWIKRISPA